MRLTVCSILMSYLMSCAFHPTPAEAAAKRFHTVVDVVKYSPPSPTPSPNVDPSLKSIHANIEISFPEQKRAIHVADVSIPDAVQSCPIDTLPPDLAKAVGELADKVRGSVNRINNIVSDQCAVLDNRMRETQDQISTAFQNQLVAEGSIPHNANQDKINQLTQRASAINEMILTTSDILSNCVDASGAKNNLQVIQKLIAQVVTLSGLFMGGWQGIAVATGGQIIGSLPLFQGSIEQALKFFKKYDEMNEKTSFLCFYRQLRKSSCLLFSTEDDRFINGLDLSFATGPVQTTLNSLKKYKASNSDIVADLNMLRGIKRQSESYRAVYANTVAGSSGLSSPSLSVLSSEFDRFCTGPVQIKALQSPGQFKPNLIKHLSDLMSLCDKTQELVLLNASQFQTAYDLLDKVSSYYTSLKRTDTSISGKIAQTIESMSYFEGFRKSIRDYQNLSAGNQERLNFRHLTVRLGASLARDSFVQLFEQGYRVLFKSNWEKKAPIENVDVRRRALFAMIDLCQTFDPTLSCMSRGSPVGDPFFRTWKHYCVGWKSRLCYGTLMAGERELLLTDSAYQVYFDSLCGSKGLQVNPRLQEVDPLESILGD